MEKWKNVDGFENYQISNLGSVKSLPKKVKNKQGYRTTRLRFLKPTISHGYAIVMLNYKRLRVHRLVALAFIPNIDDKPFINHIDGNKLNNHFTNLEWCTQKENVHHAFETNLTSGKNGAILTNNQVTEIKKLLNGGITQTVIAKKFNVNRVTITLINTKKTWKEI